MGNVEMDSIAIGPSSKQEWLLGDYAHERFRVPRLKAIIEEYTIYDGVEDTSPIAIPNRYNNIRCITGNQISSQLEYKMSIAYDCAINRYIQKPNLVQRIVMNMMVMQFAWGSGGHFRRVTPQQSGFNEI